MSDLKLIVGNKNYSSWSLRPWIALKYFEIEFEEIVISLHDWESFYREIAKYSDAKKVPVLLHEGAVIWDSLSILEYLAELFPKKSLWPESREARGHARSICAEMHSGFNNIRNALPMNLRRPVENYPLTPEVRTDISRIFYVWREARRKYADEGPFLYGPFSNADAMFAPVVSRFQTYGVPVDSYFHAYMDAILSTHAFQQRRADGLKETWIVDKYEV